MGDYTGILETPAEIADSGINAVNKGALQGLDLNDPAQLNKAATALVGLGQSQQLTNLSDYATKGIARGILQKYASGGGLDYDANGNKTGGQTAANPNSGKMPSALNYPQQNSQSSDSAQPAQANQQVDPQANQQTDPQAAVAFHAQAIAAANAIKASGPANSPERAQAIQAAKQHFQAAGVPESLVDSAIGDGSDNALNSVILDHVGHAHDAANGTGAYASGQDNQSASVSTTPDTNTYQATSAVAQDASANPQAAQAIPASTATVTPPDQSQAPAAASAPAPDASQDQQDPESIPSPQTGMSIKQARAYLSPEYKNYVAAAKLAGIDLSGNIDTANATLKPIQGSQETISKNLADLQTSGTVNLSYADGSGEHTFANKSDAIDAVRKHPGVYGALGKAEQGAQTTTATQAATPRELYDSASGAQLRFQNQDQQDKWQTEHPNDKLVNALPEVGTQPTINADGSQGPSVVATKAQLANQANGQNSSAPSASNGGALTEDTFANKFQSLVPGGVITSGYRSPSKNASVGGVSDSNHMTGQAADVTPGKSSLSMAELNATMQAQGYHTVPEKGNKPVSDISQADHIHVDFNGQHGSNPAATSGNYSPSSTIRYGNAAPTVQASATSDNDQYNTTRSTQTTQSYRQGLIDKTNNDIQTIGLAQKYAIGAGTKSLGDIANKVGFVIPQGANEAAGVKLLDQHIAGSAQKSIAQSGVPARNEQEFNYQLSAVSNLNDPKQSIIYNAAVDAASNQLAHKYSDFVSKYDQGTGPKSYQAMQSAWEQSPDAKAGIWGQSSLRGVTFAGQPLVQSVPNKRTGKIDLIVGRGLGPQSTIVVPGQ